ncbi:MAG TPA: TRAP transporter small permease, partial [Stellaceae bacterium]|nr:TRAP transporter small permease [Stellaceae bacterium]
FAVALILLLPVPVLYEVIADQLGQPPIWVFETTGYAIIMIAFAASGLGLSTGHHFKVDLLARRFPPAAAALRMLSGLLEAAFGLILLIAGAMQAYGALTQDMRSDTLLAVPLFWPMLAFPIGGLAILLQGIAHILKRSPGDSAA